MNIEIRQTRTVQCIDREGESGLLRSAKFERDYQEVHAVFEELIHRPWGTACWFPAADVWETDEAFLIELDTPDVEPEAIHITVKGRTLSIEGTRRVAHNEADSRPHRCERPKGRFARVFCFEEPLADEHIEHRLSRGVLVVTIHKPSYQPKEEQDRNDA